MHPRFVLIEPSHPGNIGAAARALKVMGWRDLVLVRPAAFPHADATALAAGADDVLTNARVCEDLDTALADCRFVFGTSARHRTMEWPEADARGAAETASGHGDHPVAFLFGRERNGLTNAEMDVCHQMLHIPVANDYGSLNLAQAVQVVAYELCMAGASPSPTGDPSNPSRSQRSGAAEAEPLPAHAEMRRFYDHLQQALVDIDFLDPTQPDKLMRRLRRLFQRAQPRPRELRILRGILTAAQWPGPDAMATQRARAGQTRPRGGTISDSSDQE